MKLALIGAGTVTAFYFGAAALLADVDITDAFDPDDAALQRLPPEVERHATLDAMLERSHADVFVVASPSDTHVELATRLVAAGAYVAVEKPMAVDQAQLHALENAVHNCAERVYGMFHFAFGAEVVAWNERQAVDRAALGPVGAACCGFYDPYLSAGALLPRANSLIGSWTDSGINALSVVDAVLSPDAWRVRSASMTAVPGVTSSQIAGNAFGHVRTGEQRAFFAVDTNWTLGVNAKITQLFYEHAAVTLDHSSETISVAWDDGRTEEIRADSGVDRMAVHYAGVFDDLRRRWLRKTGNSTAALALHRVFVDAMGEHAKWR